MEDMEDMEGERRKKADGGDGMRAGLNSRGRDQAMAPFPFYIFSSFPLFFFF